MSSLSTAVSLPTLAAIERRRRELLNLQCSQPPEPFSEEPEPPSPESEEPEPEAPLSLTAAAFHGLAGDTVRSLAPHSEAAPAAILLQFLAAFGNVIGPAPHALAGAARHGLNLFVILVGETSKARKGTSWRQIASLFAEVDPNWASRRVTTTQPTPAAIMKSLRDQLPVTDRRLFFLAEEFASTLHVLGRPSGQLSPLLRCAWDGGDLCASNGHHSVQATAAHISLVGHITQSELVQHLSRKESHNGFANRCLWTSVRRSQSLPDGGSLSPDRSTALVRDLSRAVQWTNSQTALLFRRTEEARALWNDCYPALSLSRPDEYGAATSRAEAQVLRLSALYAALDCSSLVETFHMEAALAVWNYCQASARLFFDGAPIDPVARRINTSIGAHVEGLSKTQIGALFHGHVSVERIDLALEQLSTLGLILNYTAVGRGRPATVWASAKNKQLGT